MSRLLINLFRPVVRQLLGTTKPKQKFIFTKNMLLKMSQNRLTQQQIRDTFYSGKQTKPGMIIRQYNGYHIGLFCKIDYTANEVLLISCWTRKT